MRHFSSISYLPLLLHVRVSIDDRLPPLKMVAQCPGPFETAQGVTHTSPEIYGSGAYVLQIAAATTRQQQQQQQQARASGGSSRPGLDLSQAAAAVDGSDGMRGSSGGSSSVGQIQTSVPTVTVSPTSLGEQLNYSLSLRVWPPRPANPAYAMRPPLPGSGCGWGTEDVLGAVFNLPVKELIELSLPPQPFAAADDDDDDGNDDDAAAAAAAAAAAQRLRRTHSFHPDGGVYLATPLLRMPPSPLAGRDTGFFLRLHLKLEAA